MSLMSKREKRARESDSFGPLRDEKNRRLVSWFYKEIK
jgi:hypothetical protein